MGYNIQVIDQSNPILGWKIFIALFKEGFRVAAGLDDLVIWSREDEFRPHSIILGDTGSTDRLEACFQLRQAMDVPIVMLGEVPGADAWCQAVEAGADCYLVTPISYPELVNTVKAILRHHYELPAISCDSISRI